MSDKVNCECCERLIDESEKVQKTMIKQIAMLLVRPNCTDRPPSYFETVTAVNRYLIGIRELVLDEAALLIKETWPEELQKVQEIVTQSSEAAENKLQDIIDQRNQNDDPDPSLN